MGISSISAISNTVTTSAYSSDTSSLDSQKASIEQQISSIESGKDDDKTKQAKISKLKAQLERINAQIQLKKTEGASQGSSTSENKVDVLVSAKKEATNYNILDTFV